MEGGGTESDSALPWYWVIETLARSQLKGVNVTPLLYELVSKAPPSSSNSAQRAREALSLRCLEDLFGFCDALSDESCMYGKGFDLADSCEEVLGHVLNETSGIDLRKDASDELKRNVCSFIKCKKANLPRSILELLKNTIVEGTHPLVASLKEISGVAFHKHVQSIPSSNGHTKSPSATNDEGGHGSQAVLPGQNDFARHEACDDHLQIPNENSHELKRDASAFRNDNHAQRSTGTSCDMNDHGPSGKKRRLDQQSKEQISVPYDGSGEKPNDHQPPKSNDSHDREYDRGNISCLDKITIDNPDQPHILPDENDLPGEVDLQTKLSFLSSQGAFSQDSLVLADSEVNLCMKCNKGGQLLICSSRSCPLAFHVSCLGCSANFDDQGNFYCPFCAYSRAISEYAKAKKKASLARKELSLFIGGKNSYLSKENSKKALEDDGVDQRRKDKNIADVTEHENHANAANQVANQRNLRSSKGKTPKSSAPSSPLTEPKNGKSEKHTSNATQVASPRLLRSSKVGEGKISSAPSTPQTEQKNGADVVTPVVTRRQLRSSSKS